MPSLQINIVFFITFKILKQQMFCALLDHFLPITNWHMCTWIRCFKNRFTCVQAASYTYGWIWNELFTAWLQSLQFDINSQLLLKTDRAAYLVSSCNWIRLQRSDSMFTSSVYFVSIRSHLWEDPPTWPFQWLALDNSASIAFRIPFFWSSSALMFCTSTHDTTSIIQLHPQYNKNQPDKWN